MVRERVRDGVVLNREDLQAADVVSADRVIRVFDGFLPAKRRGDKAVRQAHIGGGPAEGERCRRGQQLDAVGDQFARVEVGHVDRRNLHPLREEDRRLADGHQRVAGRQPGVFALQADHHAPVDLIDQRRALEGEVEHGRLGFRVAGKQPGSKGEKIAGFQRLESTREAAAFGRAAAARSLRPRRPAGPFSLLDGSATGCGLYRAMAPAGSAHGRPLMAAWRLGSPSRHTGRKAASHARTACGLSMDRLSARRPSNWLPLGEKREERLAMSRTETTEMSEGKSQAESVRLQMKYRSVSPGCGVGVPNSPLSIGETLRSTWE